MKKFLSVAISLVISVCGIAQTDSTISLIAYWEIGDSVDYQITKSVTEINGDSTKVDTTLSTITFIVIDSTSTSYEIEWIYNDVNLDMFNQILPELDMGSSSEKLKVRYLTDEYGAFTSITNYNEIESFYRKMLSDIALLYSIFDSSFQKEELESMFLKLFDKNMIQNSLKEIHYFHSLFGGIYDLCDTVRYSSKSPPVFGNKTVRTDGILYSDTVYPDVGIFVMINEEKLNQQDSKRIIAEFIDEIDISYDSRKEKRKKNKEFDEVIDNAYLEIYKYDMYQYEYFYGFPLYIYGETEVQIDIEGEITYKKQVLEMEIL